MDKTRVYGVNTEINPEEVKQMYANRANKSKTVHIDAPVVLSSDSALENIELWTSHELEKWFPLMSLNEDSVVFELGFGTGRMTKYIIPIVKQYIGIDYVQEFVDIIEKREDIGKKENTLFFNADFQSFLKKANEMKLPKFTHFFLSGGVFMYMNDAIVEECIEELEKYMSEKSIIYISEPIALKERLTLNSFYSETMKSNYSAIYRTEKEYKSIFEILLKKGFRLKVNEHFFEDDIKKQKETRQWIFILER